MTATESPTIPQPPAADPIPAPPLRKRVRFAVAFLLTFLVVCAGIVTIHVLGNPAFLFPSPIVPNHDNRAWKTRRIAALKTEGKTPKIVVLGSSRMMQMSPMVIEAITHKRAFNYANVGASPMEYLAQLKHLIHSGAKPEMIIVGIDDRAMFGLYRQWEGKIVEDWNILRETPLKRQLPLEWRAVTQIRLSDTPLAIRQLIHGPVFEVKTPLEVENLLLGDGYRIRAKNAMAIKRRPLPPAQRQAVLKKTIAGRVKDTEKGFTHARVQQEQKDYVNAILKLATSKGIAVKFVMTPMQPYYAEAVIKGQPKKEIDKYASELRQACKRRHAEFYDCRDIKSFAGIDYEFWDEQHPTPVNTMRMANAIFGLKPRTRHPEVPDDSQLVLHPPAITSLNTW